jgi:hypothetical protein
MARPALRHLQHAGCVGEGVLRGVTTIKWVGPYGAIIASHAVRVSSSQGAKGLDGCRFWWRYSTLPITGVVVGVLPDSEAAAIDL